MMKKIHKPAPATLLQKKEKTISEQLKPLKPVFPIEQYQGTFNHTYPAKPIPKPVYEDFRTKKRPEQDVIPDRYQPKTRTFKPYSISA